MLELTASPLVHGIRSHRGHTPNIIACQGLQEGSQAAEKPLCTMMYRQTDKPGLLKQTYGFKHSTTLGRCLLRCLLTLSCSLTAAQRCSKAGNTITPVLQSLPAATATSAGKDPKSASGRNEWQGVPASTCRHTTMFWLLQWSVSGGRIFLISQFRAPFHVPLTVHSACPSLQSSWALQGTRPWSMHGAGEPPGW